MKVTHANICFPTHFQLIHVSRPLAHLFLMFSCGQKSWTPWTASLALDCLSLSLHRRHASSLSPQDRAELASRSLSLFMYLMRSPFYDSWTKARLIASLSAVSRVFRPAAVVTEPLARYLPEWQETYFYTWAS
jgi:peroxin-16